MEAAILSRGEAYFDPVGQNRRGTTSTEDGIIGLCSFEGREAMRERKKEKPIPFDRRGGELD